MLEERLLEIDTENWTSISDVLYKETDSEPAYGKNILSVSFTCLFFVYFRPYRENYPAQQKNCVSHGFTV